MNLTAHAARTLAAFVLVVAAFVALGSVLTSGTPAHAVQAVELPAVEAPEPAAPVEAVSEAYTADEAFLADLLGPDTDASPEQAARLIDLATRYCDKVVGGDTLPGAEVQTREGWLAGLTMPGDAHALTLSEAGKLLDTAEAAYCPSRI